jgi:hypothetical protein
MEITFSGETQSDIASQVSDFLRESKAEWNIEADLYCSDILEDDRDASIPYRNARISYDCADDGTLNINIAREWSLQIGIDKGGKLELFFIPHKEENMLRLDASDCSDNWKKLTVRVLGNETRDESH